MVQLNHRYILVYNQQGLFLIDQHAAHERILFEQYRHSFGSQPQAQPLAQLSQPLHLQLSSTQRLTLKPHLPTLKRLGLTIEEEGEDFLLKTLPSLFDPEQIRPILCRVILDLDEQRQLPGLENDSDKVIAYSACRSAVKDSDPLTKNQIKILIQKLSVTAHNLTCLHGGPIVKKFTWAEVGRWFGRR